MPHPPGQRSTVGAPAAVRRDGAALRESELSRLWQEQRLPPEALVTAGGEDVQIVYRGRRGAGPGPDFRDAVVRITPRPPRLCTADTAGAADTTNPGDGETRAARPDSGAAAVRGDVELHVRSSDFRRHGHHLDRGYLRLALHVVFIDDGDPTTLLDGRVVPTVALERWVQRRAGEIRLTLADPTVYREPCHGAVARLGAEAVSAALLAGGAARLREHAARLAPPVDEAGPAEALYLALARALGLTRDCAPLEAIARAVPLAELRALTADSGDPALTVEAALLGAAGLLDGQLALWPAVDDAREARLLAEWQAIGAPRAPDLAWAGGLQRPGCTPRERLLGLAALVQRTGPPLDATLDEWRGLLAQGPRALLDCLRAGRQIGRDRALELAINAALPWLLAAHPADAPLAATMEQVYAALPAPVTYAQTRLLTGALQDAAGHSLVRGAAAVQGALALSRDWCTQGGCGRCPLSR